jgi:hypothetical protein
MSHGGLKRARSWKRRIQPKEAYSSPGLLYSETCAMGILQQLAFEPFEWPQQSHHLTEDLSITRAPGLTLSQE